MFPSEGEMKHILSQSFSVCLMVSHTVYFQQSVHRLSTLQRICAPFNAHSQPHGVPIKYTQSVCLPIHETTREPLNGFS